MIKELELLTYEERLKAGAVQPGEEKALEDLINVYIYLTGVSKEGKARLFAVVPSDRTRGSGHKLTQKME